MNKGVVFIYHRVIDLKQDPKELAVHPQRFEAQIEYLKKAFTVISLRELTDRIATGKSVANCAVITFDDGYADNLYNALPILKKHQAPATVFITTHMVGGGREFWWDELERIFLAEAPPHKPLTLIIAGRRHTWNIGDRTTAADVYKEMHPLLKYLPHRERDNIMDQLFAWSELDRDAGRETHRILNKEEIRELARGEWVDIGAHTLTHPVLAVESEEKRRLEITQSGKTLEQWLGREIHSFSYPFGHQRDIDDYSVNVVKEAGYACGIANIQGSVDNKTNPYLTPRRLVRNWDLPEFRRKVDFFLKASPRTPGPAPPTISADETGDKITAYLDKITPCEPTVSPKNIKRKPQNILFINFHDQRGGAAKLAYQMFNGLEQKKFTTAFLVGKKSLPHPNIEQIAAVKTHDQRYLNAFQENEGWLDVFHASSFNIKQGRSFRDADIVHLHNLQRGYFSLLALPEITCLKPTVWTLHDMFAFTGHCVHAYDCERWRTGCGKCPALGTWPPVKKDNTDLLLELKRIVYDHSGFSIICPSNWLKSKVEKSILKDKDATVIYNGVDETLFKNHDKRKARLRLNLPLDREILLFVADKGLRHRVKGGDMIPRLLDTLSRKNLLLLSIGEPGADLDNLKTLPYIKDAEQLSLYYSAADVFLYPSLADNCPLVVLESLSCGTPVVSFNTGGIPELVTHRKTGYIAEYRNLADLADGVRFYLDNPLLLKKAGRNARKAILKTFTLKKMIKNYLELYKTTHRDFFKSRHGFDERYKIAIAGLLNENVKTKD